jgi:hypothetical protein
MRSVTLALSAVLFLSGALTAQEHSHPVPPVAPTGAGASANPDIIRLDRSEELLAAIRSTAREKDAAALRSAAEAYVSYISALRNEMSRFPRAEAAGPAFSKPGSSGGHH